MLAVRCRRHNANDRLNSDTYDNNGNTTTSSSNGYAYDFENRLTSLNNGAATFTYDGDGNRVGKTVGGVTTNYHVDTNNHTGYAVRRLVRLTKQG